MNAVQIRNYLAKGLTGYLGVPVVLSSQVAPEAPVPYGIYTVTVPYVPDAGMGNHTHLVEGDSIHNVRREMPSMTISYTFCSQNRTEGDIYIYGDDEAQTLAEKAIGWFRHVAYNDLAAAGIVVSDIQNAGNRTTLVVDEAARRYGFDVRIRYTRVDTRTDDTIRTIVTTQKE